MGLEKLCVLIGLSENKVQLTIFVVLLFFFASLFWFFLYFPSCDAMR